MDNLQALQLQLPSLELIQADQSWCYANENHEKNCHVISRSIISSVS